MFGRSARKTMDGVVLMAQESRIQLRDDGGATHFFMLGHSCLAEPSQLVPLARRQARVRIEYVNPHNIIGQVAKSITLLDAD